MTAEIAIINLNGIALAADSAITVELPSGEITKKKTFNTSNKLFSASKFHPVGIMVYGRGGLLNTPWETIIKLFRKDLGDTELDNLHDYAEKFIKYLDTFFSEEDQKTYFSFSIQSFFYHWIFSPIDNQVKEKTKESKISEKEIIEIADKVISKEHENLEKIKKLEYLPSDFGNQIINKYGEQIEESIEIIFEDLPISDDSRAKLYEIISLIHTKNIFPVVDSGIVFAGFGKNENFPALYSFNISGVVNNRTKYRINERQCIDGSQPSSLIVPFAQREMVDSFMEGISPDLEIAIEFFLSELLNDYSSAIVEKLNLEDAKKKVLLDSLLEENINIIRTYNYLFNSYKKEEYIDKIIDTVSFLPKEDLAEMAESLVNLTSFKRRVTMVEETVGGPIDVVVISKGDGFVWIKRKHYFEAKLNHHFFNNYFKL